MERGKIRSLAFMGVFASFTGVLSQIAVPLPFTPIPINLAMISVFLAGALLGGKKGATSQLIYLLVGGVGMPVFAGFKGGIAALVGPTGGYLVGYVATAWIVGLIVEGGKRTTITAVFSMVLGLGACYTLGTMWFMFTTGSGLIPSLSQCVFPFLIGDGIKISVSALGAVRIRNAIPTFNEL